MELHFLGTGTSTGVPEIGCSCRVCKSTDPKDKRLRTSALVTTQGKNILIDCGPDFRAQMLRLLETRHIDKIDGILITHEHYDHVGGMDDLRLFCKKGSLDIYAEQQVAHAIEQRMPYAFKEHRYPGVPHLQIKIIDNRPFMLTDIEITPIRLYHARLPILGFRIGNMAYLTDLKTIPKRNMPN
jgi:Metal-dependent hydrolases of the beta-lactamase superfamily I